MAEVKDKVVTAESLKALHDYNANSYVKKTDTIPLANGGTDATDGATGLANLFAAGTTILSPHQYGDELPDAGTAGRIFFKKLSE